MPAPIVRDGPTPIWRQIADDIADQITGGRLLPGDRLPSERVLCAQYGDVAYGTIRRAIKGLRERGLVETSPGKGTYVTA